MKPRSINRKNLARRFVRRYRSQVRRNESWIAFCRDPATEKYVDDVSKLMAQLYVDGALFFGDFLQLLVDQNPELAKIKIRRT